MSNPFKDWGFLIKQDLLYHKYLPSVSAVRHGFFQPFHRHDFHPGYALLGLVALGDNRVGKAQLGGFLEAFLAALDGAHFTGQADLTEHHQFPRQRLVFQ